MSARGPNSVSSMEYRRDRKHEPNRLGEASTVASTVCEQQMVCLPVPPHLLFYDTFSISPAIMHQILFFTPIALLFMMIDYCELFHTLYHHSTTYYASITIGFHSSLYVLNIILLCSHH